MSEQTQRWMKRELDHLLAQRARYVQAETASADVRQKVRHTTQRIRLEQEILGRREALHALGRQTADTRRRTDEGLARPRAAAAAPPSMPRRPDRSTGPLALVVCVTTFALGAVIVGTLMSPARRASPAPMVQHQRYRPLGPATPVRVPKQRDEPVMAAGARPSVRRAR